MESFCLGVKFYGWSLSESFVFFSFFAHVINRELLLCLHECLISPSS